jgi:hypothetical protein
MPQTSTVCLDQAVTPVSVQPGEKIVLRGSFHSKHDGSTVDAASTTWPAEAPGGASIDSGGLIDFVGGGFHISERNTTTHVVEAIATGEAAPACAAAGVQAPCLPVRLVPQAHTRLITVDTWKKSLIGGSPNGCFTLEAHTAVLPPIPPAQQKTFGIIGGALGLAAVAGFAWVLQRRRAASPAGQLRALAKRVRSKLNGADAVLAAPLVPAIESALRALKDQRVDASSAEGKRVMRVLERVDAQLDQSAQMARDEEEQRAADELVREVESALEAAEEAQAIGGRRAER